MTITIIIIVITAAISFMAFNNRALFEKLQLNPYQIYHQSQWYRVVTHAFLHADYMHLIINMIVLFSFGLSVENQFDILAHKGLISSSAIHLLLLYFIGIVVATSTTIIKHKDNYNYNSIGASGAVSAVVFAAIFFSPKSTILIMGILPIPAILFGIMYLLYTQYKSIKGNDNVNHDAHFIGAVFGFIYPIIIEPSLFNYFINHLF